MERKRKLDIAANSSAMKHMPMSSFFKPKVARQENQTVSESTTRESTTESDNGTSEERDRILSSDNPAPQTEVCMESSIDTVERASRVDPSCADSVELTGLEATFATLHPSWRDILSAEIKRPYFRQLASFVNSEYSSRTIFPPANTVFAALNLCPFDKVKVVVVGQDPYHGPNQAHGLAFSVMRGVDIPQSLRNIFKEAKSDPKLNFTMPTHGNLVRWSEQGVLLLNVCLTVRKGEANSHQGKGWETFTDAIIRELSKKSGLVYLLWGKPAQLKCKAINQGSNCVITSSHPSPLGAYQTSQPFIGSRCFARCNEYLVAHGKEIIDWNTM